MDYPNEREAYVSILDYNSGGNIDSIGQERMKMKCLRIMGISLILLLLVAVSIPGVIAQQQSYTVQAGDSIQFIADRFNVSVDALLQFNGIIDPNRIVRGQVLQIPTGVVSPPSTHLVQPGESLQWIAERYNVEVAALIELNDITDPSRLTVGRLLDLPPTGGPSIFTQSHTVQAGETLRSIAAQYSTTWEQLASANNLTNPNLLQVGQTLIVPAFTAVTPVPTAQPTAVPVVVTPQAPTVPQQTQLRTYVVKVGDNPSLIADRFGVTLLSLIDLNNLRGNLPIYAGDILLIPPTGGTVGNGGGQTPVVHKPGRYTVVAGDTMFLIASKYGKNIYAIAQANGILNLNAIYVGQVLVIP